MSRPLPVRRLFVAAVAPLALVTLGACGGDGSSGDDPRTSSEGFADDRSGDPAEGPAEDPAGEAPAGDTVEPAAFLETYRAGFGDATVHLEMAVDNAAYGEVAIEGDADFSQDAPAMVLTMSGGPGGDAEVRVVGGSMYIRTETQGDRFVELPMELGGASLGSLAGGQLDPRALVEGLGDAIGPVERLGETDLDGESVEHYRFTVPGAALASQSLGGIEAPEIPGMPEEVVFDVYFDEDERVRRVGGDMGELGTMTVDLTDWGKDVSVEQPSEDELTEIPGAGGPPEVPEGSAG